MRISLLRFIFLLSSFVICPQDPNEKPQRDHYYTLSIDHLKKKDTRRNLGWGAGIMKKHIGQHQNSQRPVITKEVIIKNPSINVSPELLEKENQPEKIDDSIQKQQQQELLNEIENIEKIKSSLYDTALAGLLEPFKDFPKSDAELKMPTVDPKKYKDIANLINSVLEKSYEDLLSYLPQEDLPQADFDLRNVPSITPFNNLKFFSGMLIQPSKIDGSPSLNTNLPINRQPKERKVIIMEFMDFNSCMSQSDRSLFIASLSQGNRL